MILGDGSGATATAIVQDGAVVDITVTNTGSGYTAQAIVLIASPPFAPSLEIEVSRVNVKLRVVLQRRYQLQTSNDFVTWTNQGESFVAQDELITMEFVVGQTGRYFKLNEVP